MRLAHRSQLHAFTLVEMLVVVSIIVVLMSLAFPAFQSVHDSAKKAQAKNDLVQIVTAITAFYTEYGQYPCGAQSGSDTQDFYTNTLNDKQQLWNNLRAYSGPFGYNTKGIPFLQPATAKNLTQPVGGLGGDGVYYDPWGSPYLVRMDNNYNNLIPNPYSKNAGFAPNMNGGVIAWSIGKDKASDAMPGPAADKNSGTNKDDVVSWQ